MTDGCLHRIDNRWVLPHAEIIIRAPDNDVMSALRAVPAGVRMPPGLSFQLDKTAITVFAFQLIQAISELLAVLQFGAPKRGIYRSRMTLVLLFYHVTERFSRPCDNR